MTHPGIAIWGTLEARVQAADRVILGGLNEGIWPRAARRRPLARTRPAPGARPAEPGTRRSASPPTTSSRRWPRRASSSPAPLRDAEAPTVASRWLLRLENLLGGLAPEGRPHSTPPARAAVPGSRSPPRSTPGPRVPPARRPAPRPPVAARPPELSVTADRGADPRPLRRLRRAASCGSAGSIRPARRRRPRPRHRHPRRARRLRGGDLGRPARRRRRRSSAPRSAGPCETAAPWPAVRAFWTARLMEAAPWLLDGEAGRRARGHTCSRARCRPPELAGLALPFAVTAKADRIDRTARRLRDLRLQVRQRPGHTEARTRYLQLPLEAAIAEAGGFEGLEPGPGRHPGTAQVRRPQHDCARRQPGGDRRRPGSAWPA